MRRRSGFNLVEMLVVIVILPVVMLVTTRLFRVFSLEIPHGHRMVAEHTVLLHMLDQLQTDIQSSLGVQIGQGADPCAVTIRGRETTWIYRAESNGVTRALAAGDPNTRQWRLPQTHIRWSVMEPHAGVRALQVDSSIQYERFGSSRTRLARTHLFFVPEIDSAEVQP